MVAVGLIGVPRRVLNRPLAHVTMLKARDLALREGTMQGVVAHVAIQIEVLVEEAPPASRTLLAVCEFEVFLVEYLGARPVNRSGSCAGCHR